MTEHIDIRSEIENDILSILERKGPASWYIIEQHLRIPRSLFPPNTNVLTFVHDLVAAEVVRQLEVDGSTIFDLANRE